jgi:hypothetical protein
MLKANGLLTNELQEFILQPTDELLQALPQGTADAVRTATDGSQIIAQNTIAFGSGRKKRMAGV